MPEEVFALFVISILSFTALMMMGMGLRYKTRRAERQVGSGSSSLRTSELERMMKRAVMEATASLNEKIDRLERASIPADPRQLERASRPDLLADMDLHESEEETLVRERTRAANR